jgi:hypothetical protein
MKKRGIEDGWQTKKIRLASISHAATNALINGAVRPYRQLSIKVTSSDRLTHRPMRPKPLIPTLMVAMVTGDVVLAMWFPF